MTNFFFFLIFDLLKKFHLNEKKKANLVRQLRIKKNYENLFNFNLFRRK